MILEMPILKDLRSSKKKILEIQNEIQICWNFWDRFRNF